MGSFLKKDLIISVTVILALVTIALSIAYFGEIGNFLFEKAENKRLEVFKVTGSILAAFAVLLGLRINYVRAKALEDNVIHQTRCSPLRKNV